MPHTLYTFGLACPPHAQGPSTTSCLPQPVLTAERIRILWTSWCDCVIAHQDADDIWAVEYTGAGLTAAQKERIDQDDDVRAAVSEEPGTRVIRFFGSVMHDGLRGYVLSHEQLDAVDPIPARANKVVIFATDLEIDDGAPECENFVLDKEDQLVDIKLASGGDAFVSLRSRSGTMGEGRVLHVRNLAAVRAYLTSGSGIAYEIAAPFAPDEWSFGSTTATAVNKEGEVLTYTRDPRYPRCLGRPSDGADDFQPVPYLSETRIVGTASGGYLHAALSADGELFIWGHACPGAAGELRVLNETTPSAATKLGSESVLKGTWIAGVHEQDEIVKCLSVQVAGKEAIVSDVAVGFGHVLVAAEVPDIGGEGRAVLAAGHGSDGQLGLGTGRHYQIEFEEIVVLRGRRVAQLVTAGWSSWVVTSE